MSMKVEVCRKLEWRGGSERLMFDRPEGER